MKLRNALVGASLAAVALAPLAAEARTAASAAVPSVGSSIASGSRASSSVVKKNGLDGTETVLLVVAAGAAGYGAYELAKDDKSRGS